MAKELRLQLLLSLAYGCGLRAGEVVILTTRPSLTLTTTRQKPSQEV